MFRLYSCASVGATIALAFLAFVPARATQPKSDLAKATPDFTMDADAWHTEWSKDRDAARKKYTGKIIELNAVVESADDDIHCKVGYVRLKLKKEVIFAPRCILDDTAPWLKVGPGCTIKVRGMVAEL